VDFRHCQVLDLVGSAVAFPKSIEFWKDRRRYGINPLRLTGAPWLRAFFISLKIEFDR
jgi:hypothetical protein